VRSREGKLVHGGDDFDRAVLLALALLIGVVLLACAGLAFFAVVVLRPTS